MKKIALVIGALVLFFGCAKMEDYMSHRNGSICIEMETGFREGCYRKAYLVLEGTDVILRVGDTRARVTDKIGSPDTIEYTVDGYERWEYKEKELMLYFGDNQLKFWKD
ncbi:MAG: hypothetical protein JSW17_06935 [Candidatus Omnitrophota bacterium]|nr:MAG: hypothetical protein JSW17_06935 [Candidatus Omnitrophota bacterium]